MKKIIFTAMIAGSVLMSEYARAQCENGTITDPTYNHGTINKTTNLWDWTSQTGTGSFNGNGAEFYKINPNSTMYQNYSVPPILGSPIGIESPYYNSGSTQLANYVAFGASSDFKYKDGWELITRNFGYSYDEVSTAVSDATVPYFVLYNKYSGMLRIFGVLPTRGGGGNVNSVTVQVKFLTPADEQGNPNYANYKYSALLGVNGGSSNPDPVSGIPYGKAQALDQPTTVNNLAQVVPFTGYDNQFFYADFAVGYDPCTCWNKGGLQISFYTNTTGSIVLSGRFVGTSVPIADVANGHNNDAISYLAGVNTNNNAITSGSLVYENINDLISEYTAQTGTNVNANIVSNLDKFSKGTAFIAKVSAMSGDEEAAAAFEAMSLLSDFVASVIPESGEESGTAAVIKGEMKLSGTLNMTAQNPEAFIKMALPGTSTNANPEFYTAANPIPNYTKYNEALGPFALLQTPSINVSNLSAKWGYPAQPANNTYYRYEFQVADAIKYIFNPAVHADLSKTVVKVALDMEYLGYNTPNVFPFPDGIAVHGATWAYTNVPDPAGSPLLVSKHFVTDYVDPKELANQIISVENMNGIFAYRGLAEFTVYLKVIVNLMSTDLKADGIPNQSLLMFTYPIVVNNNSTTNNLSGMPLFVIPGDNYDYVAPATLTIGTKNYSYSETDKPWDGVVINGAVTANAGVQVQLLTYEGGVTMNPGSSIGPGISLGISHPQFAPNQQSGPFIGSGLLQSWCAGTSSILPNAYKAGALGTNISAARISNKPGDFDNSNVSGNSAAQGSLSIYPNPLTDGATIKYSLPASGNVELAVYNILGEKLEDVYSGFKDSGNYSTNLKSDRLEQGIYTLRIKSGDYIENQRIVITK